MATLQGIINPGSVTELFRRGDDLLPTSVGQQASPGFCDIAALMQKLSQINQQQQQHQHQQQQQQHQQQQQANFLLNSHLLASAAKTSSSSGPVTLNEAELRQVIDRALADHLKSSNVRLEGSLIVSLADQTVSVKFPEEATSNENASPTKVPLTPRSASNKRKNSNPIRLMVKPDEAEDLTSSPIPVKMQAASPVAENVQHQAHQQQHSHHQTGSQPSSPSADSGVLDLSRANSQAGSAPITPLKESNLTAGSTFNPGKPLLDYLQNLQFPSNLMLHKLASNDFKYMTNLSQSFPLFATTGPIHAQTQQLYSSVGSSPLKSPLKAHHQALHPHQQQQVRKRISNGPRGVRQTPIVRRANGFARKFPCNQCNEQFPSLNTLENHTMGVHKGYRCHICQAQFTQRSNLQRHALKHVGFKPFECRVCGKAYYRKDHLIRHMEMGHPGCNPRENITVHLTSSESLEFLNRKTDQPQQQTSQTEAMFIDPKIQALLDDVDDDPAVQGLDETDGHPGTNRVSDSTVSISQEMMDMDIDQSAQESFEEEASSSEGLLRIVEPSTVAWHEQPSSD